ncbi:hypothetical protein [Hydrogenobacter hydrogenophilus]|uniref:Lipoprotein n=1 Tax=Hydrogenobacter hydrogenophilus TaxID=35835 RepID=A0A285NQW3_9AQUI|nr:hypothetical protein [Hydrogenobacter hydrogenophilus]SNZ11598.1 hypothetical protein SAMN06265353_0283 [Hydrogenobacter hydrogenophilus]
MRKGFLSLAMGSMLIASCGGGGADFDLPSSGGGGGGSSNSVKFKNVSVQPTNLQTTSSFSVSWTADYSGMYVVEVYQSPSNSVPVPKDNYRIATVNCFSFSEACKGSSGSIQCKIDRGSPNIISCNVGGYATTNAQLVSGTGYIVLRAVVFNPFEETADIRSVQVVFP